MITALMASVTGPSAADIASAATRAMAAAVQTARTLMAPVAAGLSARPAAASLAASNASLDQPTESWPASIAGATSAGPPPWGAACAASKVVMAVMASDGPG